MEVYIYKPSLAPNIPELILVSIYPISLRWWMAVMVL
jgi:hypothetical protein